MQLLSDFDLEFKKFDWMDDAACRGVKNVDFFPEESFTANAPKAIAICDDCPVCSNCLEFAVKNRIVYGIWGGMTPLQRKYFVRGGGLNKMEDS
jgi:WhiB family redox-sensing transcriptional regulator